MRHVPGAVDVHVQQLMTTPTLLWTSTAYARQQVGLTQREIAQNVLVTLSSSFQTAPTFWLNPATGVSYKLPCNRRNIE